jgi:hypothetical protein
MYEHGDSVTRQHDVRSAWEVAPVKPKPESGAMQHLSHR